MYRIISPKGELKSCRMAVGVCEKKFDFNGRQKFLLEKAESLEVAPTAIALQAEDAIRFGCYTSELIIGNLAPTVVREILRKMASEGYYDFSQFEYQKTVNIEELVIDDGLSMPYTSDITFLGMLNPFCDSLNPAANINNGMNIIGITAENEVSEEADEETDEDEGWDN